MRRTYPPAPGTAAVAVAAFATAALALAPGADASAQTLAPAPPSGAPTALYFADAAWADVDGDGDADLLQLGYAADETSVTQLYLNDGDGNLTLDARADFPALADGGAAFADTDGDGDLDLALAGMLDFRPGGGATDAYSSVWLNDGTGAFALGTANLPAPRRPVPTWTDHDGDGAPDLFISGDPAGGTPFAALLLNDGRGALVVPSDTFLVPAGSAGGRTAVADFDGDGRLDLFPYGHGTTPRLFFNRGDTGYVAGSFTGFTTPTAVAAGDVDGDGDADFVASGADRLFGDATYVLRNRGDGTFEERERTPLPGYSSRGHTALADVNGDGALDVLLSTAADGVDKGFEIGLNDGTGAFALLTHNVLLGTDFGDFAVADADGDGDLDVYVVGETRPYGLESQLYLNGGAADFGAAYPDVTPIVSGALAFGDLDGDGDPDLLSFGDGFAERYRNDGGRLRRVHAPALVRLSDAGAALGDIDGDGDLDAVAVGYTANTEGAGAAVVYRNDGTGAFAADTTGTLPGLHEPAVALADLDGDGDLDAFLAGGTDRGGFRGSAGWYRNDGTGVFAPADTTTFAPVADAKATLGDVDGDGDVDIVLSGRVAGQDVNRLYRQGPAGDFAEDAEAPFPGIVARAVALGDVDGDGDVDAVAAPIFGALRLYRQGDDGGFVFDETQVLPRVNFATGVPQFALADVDGDGDADLVTPGASVSEEADTGPLMVNDGNGGFTAVPEPGLPSAIRAGLAVADVDGDGRDDVLVSGETGPTRDRVRFAGLYYGEAGVSAVADAEGYVFRVAPNPVRAGATVSVRGDSPLAEATTVDVLDATGRVVAAARVRDGGADVTLPQLPAGLYVVRVRGAGGVAARMLVVD